MDSPAKLTLLVQQIMLDPNTTPETKKLIAKLEESYDEICAKWLDVELSQDWLLDLYQRNVFVKPEIYLRSLEKISFGDRVSDISKQWVSQ